MKNVTISSKNQIVIPSSVRAKLGVRGGDRLVIDRVSSTEVVFKKEPTFYDLIGTLPTGDQDPVERVRDLRVNWS